MAGWGLTSPEPTLPERGLVIDVANDPLGGPNILFGGHPARGYGTMGLPRGIRRWEYMLCDEESDELAITDDFVFGLLA